MLSFLAAHRWLRLGLILVVVGGVAVGSYGLWIIFLHPAGPAAVSTSTLPLPTFSSGPVPTPDPPGSHIERQWKVDTSIGSFADFSDSFVGYRVQEELAGIGGNTAVGRTPDVSGTMTTVGLTLTAAEFTANLQTLVSDDDRRDGQLRRQAIETNRFPTATFVLTAPITLPDTASPTDTLTATASGNLTLHGQTRPIQIKLNGRLRGDVLVVTGSIEITFADFAIQKPESFKVLSVADHGTLEVQLFLTQT